MGLFDWLRGAKKPQGDDQGQSAPGAPLQTGDRSSSSTTNLAVDPPRPASSRPEEEIEQQDAERVNQAVHLIQQRQFDQARQLLLGVIARAPAPGAYQQQFEAEGKLHIKFWDMQEFMSYVVWMKAGGTPERDLVWLNNAYPRAFYYLGYLHIEQNDFATAIDYLEQGSALDPNSAKLKCEKAQALIRAGRQREALEVYREVLERSTFLSDSDRALALRGRGYVLIEMNDLDGAEKAFQESLELEPKSAVARNELDYIAQVRQQRRQHPPTQLLARQLGLTPEQFDACYRSYATSLQLSGEQSNWNANIDDLARQIGALTEEEIERARTDFHQAVLNRIKVRSIVDRQPRP